MLSSLTFIAFEYQWKWVKGVMRMSGSQHWGRPLYGCAVMDGSVIIGHRMATPQPSIALLRPSLRLISDQFSIRFLTLCFFPINGLAHLQPMSLTFHRIRLDRIKEANRLCRDFRTHIRFKQNHMSIQIMHRISNFLAYYWIHVIIDHDP